MLIIFGGGTGYAEVVKSELPFRPNTSTAISAFESKGWLFFTPLEGRMVEAICDRLIPPDEGGAGGKDAGCAVFIDRQLAGPYGSSEGLYLQPPFMPGTPGQGYQGADAPAAIYRKGLRAFDRFVSAKFGGKTFAALSTSDQDKALTSLADGSTHLDGEVGATLFFNTILKDTKAGYLADPIYGGNRDMVSWRMIGFPGARYDYRDWVSRHNERYPLPPVGLTGRAEWTRKG